MFSHDHENAKAATEYWSSEGHAPIWKTDHTAFPLEPLIPKHNQPEYQQSTSQPITQYPSMAPEQFHTYEAPNGYTAVPTVPAEIGSTLPPYDRADITKYLCMAGLVLCYILSILALIAGNYVIRKIHLNFTGLWSVDAPYHSGYVFAFLFNVVITACIECLSYIHTLSLRWSLYNEGRLEYNSNLRLFTSAKKSWANCLFANFASAIGLVIAYTAASTIFFSETKEGFIINGFALFMLGGSLAFLSLVSTWALIESRHTILSWSPNPLNTALACLHQGHLTRRPGRGMMSVHEANLVAQARKPEMRQKPIRGIYRAVRHIIRLLYLIFCATTLYAIVVVAQFLQTTSADELAFFQTDIMSRLGVGFNIDIFLDLDYQVQLALAFLFVAVLQSFMTLAFHAAELLINIHRDEACWRDAGDWLHGKGDGTCLKSGGLKSAFQTWPWLILLVMKPLAHWLFGTVGMFAYLYQEAEPSIRMVFNPVPLFVLAALALILVLFQEYLIRTRPKGPQPTTYGHLQTIIDLVDDWGSGINGRMWWGAKGVDASGVGLVGTSSARQGLSMPQPTEFYH